MTGGNNQPAVLEVSVSNRRGRPPKPPGDRALTNAEKVSRYKAGVAARYVQAQADAGEAKTRVGELVEQLGQHVTDALASAAKFTKAANETGGGVGISRQARRHLSHLQDIESGLAALRPAVEHLVEVAGVLLRTNGQMAGVRVTTGNAAVAE
jgi:hypothetical protein